MKQCPKCSTKNGNTARFCNNCGESLENIVGTSEEFSAAANGFLNKASSFFTDGAKDAITSGTKARSVREEFSPQPTTHTIEQPGGGWDSAIYTAASSHSDWNSATHPNVATSVTEEHYSFFRDEDEKTLAVIGGNYIASDLEGHYRFPYAVLTEKHLYCKNDAGNYVVDTAEIRNIKDNLVKISAWPLWIALVLFFSIVLPLMA
ncbi:MAG: hypothetical protein HDT15_01955 [Oscillibacter sp.]|nr:hypothetical protein [Oscillibacter sp.]